MAAAGATFLASLDPSEAELLDPEQIAVILTAKWQTGAEAFPTVKVSLEEFESALAAQKKVQGTELDSLFGVDFYLIVAVLKGDRYALVQFEQLYLVNLEGSLRRWSATLSEEAASQVREALFLATERRPAKLMQYAGIVPFGAWLDLVARRTLISLGRKKQLPVDGGDALLAVEGEGGAASPEQRALAERHGGDFRAVIADACAALSQAERDILRWHVVEGLGIDAIAPMLGVHRATAARMIHRARSVLRAHARDRLRTKLNVGESSLDSLFAELRTDVDLTVSRVLK
jgi:RNA polymerase sigma-70 factor, ECF subfamily